MTSNRRRFFNLVRNEGYVKKISRGGWSGFWKALTWDPSQKDFYVFGMHPKMIDVYPKLIPKGGVVQFCQMHFENSVTKRYSRMKVMPPCIWGEQRWTINIFLSLIDAAFLLTLNHQQRSCFGVWTVVCCVGVQLFPLVTKTRWWSGYNQPVMEQNRVYFWQNCWKKQRPICMQSMKETSRTFQGSEKTT